MSYYNPEPPTPHEIIALEKALDAMFEHIEGSKDYIEAEDLWPGRLTPHFEQIEDDAIMAEGAANRVKIMVERMNVLIDELRDQRQNALDANLKNLSILDTLPTYQADLILWLISILGSATDPQNRYRLAAFLQLLAKLKQQFEKGK